MSDMDDCEVGESVQSELCMKNKGPLWQFVTVLERIDGGGNYIFMCNQCKHPKAFKGSYSRVKGHLLHLPKSEIRQCKKATSSKRLEWKKLDDGYNLSKMKVKPSPPPLGFGSSSAIFGGSNDNDPSTKRRKGNMNTVEKCFNKSVRDEIDAEIARMFYRGGLSFSLARNPYYIRAFVKLAMSELGNYNPPGDHKLNVERLLEPIKTSWESRGVSVCCDGWSDAQRRPLTNVMVVSESGPMFIKAENTQGEKKDRFFIANLLIAKIYKIGPQNVVQVITDNAVVCKAAGALVEETFPHIFWTPCVVHTLNLALKNICAPSRQESNIEAYDRCSWVLILAEDALFTKFFIMNHGIRLYMFTEHSRLKMLTIAETRFASTIVILKRFKQIKQNLKQMVIASSWADYKDNDVGKASHTRELILSDLFWERIDYVLAFIGPIYEMLRKSDTYLPCLHLVYEWWDCMIENVKVIVYNHEQRSPTEESSFWNVVYASLLQRWTKSYTPLHCLAHSMNPKYYSVEWLAENPKRVPPHKDKEITSERLKCIERYYPSLIQMITILDEHAAFADISVDYFGAGNARQDRFLLSPKQWWCNYGSYVPNLQPIAKKVLVQPSSSSCCERNWSTYKFLHSAKSNKILPSRAEDLVFVHTNLRLLLKKTPQYKEGPSKMWDVGGDEFDPMDASGILEIASLSLDEPEFETIIFNEIVNEPIDVVDDVVDLEEE